MKNLKRLLLLLTLVLTGMLLFNACSKDKKDMPDPDPIPEVTDGTVSATIQFMDTEKSVQFTGTATGAIGSGSQDTVVMVFSGKGNPMLFWLMITPADKGSHVMGQKNFKCYGMFYQDSSKINLKEIYLVGADNIDDNDTEMDGAATFNISSMTDNNIKGSFGLTMILNSTVYLNGELQSGEIKKLKVTNGEFNCPLFSADFSGNPLD